MAQAPPGPRLPAAPIAPPGQSPKIGTPQPPAPPLQGVPGARLSAPVTPSGRGSGPAAAGTPTGQPPPLRPPPPAWATPTGQPPGARISAPVTPSGRGSGPAAAGTPTGQPPPLRPPPPAWATPTGQPPGARISAPVTPSGRGSGPAAAGTPTGQPPPLPPLPAWATPTGQPPGARISAPVTPSGRGSGSAAAGTPTGQPPRLPPPPPPPAWATPTGQPPGPRAPPSATPSREALQDEPRPENAAPPPLSTTTGPSQEQQLQEGTPTAVTAPGVPSESAKREHLSAVKAYEQQLGPNVVRGKMYIESLPSNAVPPEERLSARTVAPGMAPRAECGYNMAMGMGPGQPCGYDVGRPMAGKNSRVIMDGYELPQRAASQHSRKSASGLLRKIWEDIEEHCADSLQRNRTTSVRSFRDDDGGSRGALRASSSTRRFRDNYDVPRRSESARRQPSRNRQESSSSNSSSSDGKSRRSRTPRRCNDDSTARLTSRSRQRSKSKTNRSPSSSSSSCSLGQRRGKGKSAKKKVSSSSSSSSSDVRREKKNGEGVECERSVTVRLSSEAQKDLQNIRKHCKEVVKSLSSTQGGNGCPFLNLLGIRSPEQECLTRPPSRNVVDALPMYGIEDNRRPLNLDVEMVAYNSVSRPSSRNFGREVESNDDGVQRPSSRSSGAQAQRMSSRGSVFRYEAQPSAFNRD